MRLYVNSRTSGKKILDENVVDRGALRKIVGGDYFMLDVDGYYELFSVMDVHAERGPSFTIFWACFVFMLGFIFFNIWLAMVGAVLGIAISMLMDEMDAFNCMFFNSSP